MSTNNSPGRLAPSDGSDFEEFCTVFAPSAASLGEFALSSPTFCGELTATASRLTEGEGFGLLQGAEAEAEAEAEGVFSAATDDDLFPLLLLTLSSSLLLLLLLSQLIDFL